MEGDLPGEKEGDCHLQETGNRKNLIGMPQRNIYLISVSKLFWQKKLAEMFSVQKPGAEFVPSWLAAETAPFYSCDKCQSVAQALPRCGVLLDPQHYPGVYNRRNSFLCELIPTSFNDIHSKRG